MSPSTHGAQFDEFSSRTSEHHGGAEFDEAFRAAEGSDPRNDKTARRPRVGKHGEHWDEFGWQSMPARHGERFDEDFGAPSAMGGEHGTWFDVFRGGTQVRAIVGGKDIEAVVVNAHTDHVVAEARNGTRHELGLGQITSFRNVPGSRATPDRQEADRPSSAAPGADAARSGALTTEHGSGPLPAAPSHGPSSSANAGHLRKADDDEPDVTKTSDAEVLDVLKQLASEDSPPAPFDRAVHAAATETVAKAHADTYGEAAAQAMTHTKAAMKAAKAGRHDEAWTHHDRAMGWHAKAHMMRTAETVAAQRSLVGKTDDDIAKLGFYKDANTAVRPSGSAPHSATHACSGCGAGYVKRDNQLHRVSGGTVDRIGTSATTGSCSNCGKPAHDAIVAKTVDSGETAVQGQDLETKKPTVLTGKTWCSHCKHFCRHTDDGKCPTCGTKQTVTKTDATDADVLKQLHDLAQEG